MIHLAFQSPEAMAFACSGRVIHCVDPRLYQLAPSGQAEVRQQPVVEPWGYPSSRSTSAQSRIGISISSTATGGITFRDEMPGIPHPVS